MTTIEHFWKDTVSGKRLSFARAVFYGFLVALSPVYAFAFRIKMENRRRKKTRVSAKVISVGNITVGGTGKTQMIEMLSEKFLGRGIKFAILCQGYKAKRKRAQPFVNGQGRVAMSVEEAGDEAFYLASRFKNVPVLAGRNRLENARLAIEEFTVEVLLLDDAFQYAQLHRDMDIVLVDATSPAGNGKLFPAGILREPVSALSRAHLVVLAKANFVPEEEREEIKKTWIAPHTAAPVFEMHVEPETLTDVYSKEEISKDGLNGKNVLVFCGIGNPESFVETVKQCGAGNVMSCVFPDHHYYNERDIRGIFKTAQSSRADAIVTTEKDAVRFAPAEKPLLPVYALKARVTIKPDEEMFVKKVLSIGSYEEKVCET